MSLNRRIYIKLLSLEEAGTVYAGHMHRDFPPSEIKPFSMIEDLWKKGLYRCYGFYEKADDKLRAYAFTMTDTDVNMLLLDYFAVCKEARGKGYGSAALALLKENCLEWDGIIVEVEDDDTTDDTEEKQLRRRRIAFYERNGVRMTAARSFAFGVDYKLMTVILGNERAEERVGEKLASVYKKMLSENTYRTMFHLR